MGKYKEKEIKVIYEPLLSDPLKSQQKIDEAFDLLFEEIWKGIQAKNKLKGGDEYVQSNDRKRDRGFQAYSGSSL